MIVTVDLNDLILGLNDYSDLNDADHTGGVLCGVQVASYNNNMMLL